MLKTAMHSSLSSAVMSGVDGLTPANRVEDSTRSLLNVAALGSGLKLYLSVIYL
jgi:hypothetical protein